MNSKKITHSNTLEDWSTLEKCTAKLEWRILLQEAGCNMQVETPEVLGNACSSPESRFALPANDGQLISEGTDYVKTCTAGNRAHGTGSMCFFTQLLSQHAWPSQQASSVKKLIANVRSCCSLWTSISEYTIHEGVTYRCLIYRPRRERS